MDLDPDTVLRYKNFCEKSQINHFKEKKHTFFY
jgi:hypothetical protein